MPLSESAQEVLEALWHEQEGEEYHRLRAMHDTGGIDELAQHGHVTVSDGRAKLTKTGLREAELAIRRHRLAERLMMDVLDVRAPVLNEVSCEFEHLLHAGLEDKVCQLLGHPRACPHGKAIPPGVCCRERPRGGAKLVSRLIDLEPGEGGRIAYIATSDSARMRELMAIGAVPGMSAKLLRKFPAYVLMLAESQFAIDADMARAIYVRVQT